MKWRLEWCTADPTPEKNVEVTLEVPEEDLNIEEPCGVDTVLVEPEDYSIPQKHNAAFGLPSTERRSQVDPKQPMALEVEAVTPSTEPYRDGRPSARSPSRVIHDRENSVHDFVNEDIHIFYCCRSNHLSQKVPT